MREPSDLHLLGAGEHAAVVADALGDGWRLAGCWGDDRGLDLAVLGSEDDLGERVRRYADQHFHLAFVGRPGSTIRRAAAERWSARGLRWATVIHPRAMVSSAARIGAGCFIGPGAIVNRGAVLGDHVVINSGAIVEHDVEIGDGTHLAPAAVVGGGARIGSWSSLGLGCRVRDHVILGEGVLVAMGAVVISELPAGARVAGVPARLMSGKGEA